MPIPFLAVLALALITAKAADEPVATNRNESNLPVVFLDAKDRIVGGQKVPCSFKLVSPQGAASGSTGALSGAIKIHGGVSQGYPKKSFGLTLESPARLAGMRESSHWVLNSAYIDRSLMRHKLSYDLFRSLSGAGAPRFSVASRFVEVHLNGQYHGVYLLMERVDRQLLELRSYNSNEVEHASIYKAVDHAANFSQRGHPGYEQHEPDPLTRPYWRPLDEFNRFVSSAPDADFFHPETGIASLLDLDNAIDFHLLVLLTCNLDGITKNFILARNAPVNGVPPPRFFFAPWDYDGTFGRNWNATRVEPTAWLSNHLFDRLQGEAQYRQRFAARWKQLREKQFSEKQIRSLIEENVRTLGEAARRNATRWPTSDGSYPDRLTLAEDVSQMHEWSTARLQWLDGEIAQRAARP